MEDCPPFETGDGGEDEAHCGDGGNPVKLLGVIISFEGKPPQIFSQIAKKILNMGFYLLTLPFFGKNGFWPSRPAVPEYAFLLLPFSNGL